MLERKMNERKKMRQFVVHTKQPDTQDTSETVQKYLALRAGEEIYVRAGFTDLPRLRVRTENPPLNSYYSPRSHIVDTAEVAHMLQHIQSPVSKKVHAYANFVGCPNVYANQVYVAATLPRQSLRKLLISITSSEPLADSLVDGIEKMERPSPAEVAALIKSIRMPDTHVIMPPVENTKTMTTAPLKQQRTWMQDPLERKWDPVVMDIYRQKLRMSPLVSHNVVAAELFKDARRIEPQHLPALILGPLEKVISWRPVGKEIDSEMTLHEHLKEYILNKTTTE